MNQPSEKVHRSQNFTSYIIQCINRDKGTAAALRRADNPVTEYQSWEQLAAFNIDLENSSQRIPYALVAAAIAKAKIEQDGIAGIGEALASIYDEGHNSEQAKIKLRRLLACDSVSEVCRILRPLLSLINTKNIKLNFAQLLEELLKFNFDNQRVKTRWAQDFYKHLDKKDVAGEHS